MLSISHPHVSELHLLIPKPLERYPVRDTTEFVMGQTTEIIDTRFCIRCQAFIHSVEDSIAKILCPVCKRRVALAPDF